MLLKANKVPPAAADSGYILIEPANLSTDMHDELKQDMLACVPSFLWSAKASMPCLLALGKLGPRQQEAVSQLLEQEVSEQYPPAICAWLQSKVHIEELANSVADRLLGETPDSTRVIWRYYDPRVFVLTAYLFSEEQANALLGKIERWVFPWRQRWWCLERTRPFLPSVFDRDLAWPSDDQWELLSRSLVFRTVHARLHKPISSATECLNDLAYSLKAFTETNRYLHLDNDEDRAEFAYLSTRYRNEFRHIHDLISVWNDLREKKITLREMLDRVESQHISYMEDKLSEQGVNHDER